MHPCAAAEFITRARQLIAKERLADAEILLTEAIEADGFNVEAFIERATCHLLAQRFSHAEQDCTMALRIEGGGEREGWGPARMLRAKVRLGLGDLAGAENDALTYHYTHMEDEEGAKVLGKVRSTPSQRVVVVSRETKTPEANVAANTDAPTAQSELNSRGWDAWAEEDEEEGTHVDHHIDVTTTQQPQARVVFSDKEDAIVLHAREAAEEDARWWRNEREKGANWNEEWDNEGDDFEEQSTGTKMEKKDK